MAGVMLLSFSIKHCITNARVLFLVFFLTLVNLLSGPHDGVSGFNDGKKTSIPPGGPWLNLMSSMGKLFLMIVKYYSDLDKHYLLTL